MMYHEFLQAAARIQRTRRLFLIALEITALICLGLIIGGLVIAAIKVRMGI